MQLIHDHLHAWDESLPSIPLSVARSTLAKRRWRGIAEDGAEFGFDLEHPLSDGAAFAHNDLFVYVLQQKPEPVLEIALDQAAAPAARLGWMIGNLHFQIAIAADVIRVMDDPAIRQLCDRENIRYTAREQVFQPIAGSHAHGSAH